MTRTRRLALALLACTLAAGAGSSAAQGADWPSQTLKIVVPSTAGNSLDGLARVYAEHLRTALKQTVVVENRPGANQTIGISAVKGAPADGYTLLLTSTELVRVPLLYPSIRYDPFTEFMPLSQVAATSSFLAVPVSLGVSTLQEFIERARTAPAPMTLASPGQGSASHVYGELLAQASGIKLAHVAYRGEVPMLPDLLSGRVDAGWISGHLASQYAREGKIKVLGVVSMKQRATLMPSVPTFAELGVPGLDIEGFIGFFVLAGTPSPVVDRLEAELNRIGARPDVRALIESYGFQPSQTTHRAQFEALMRGTHQGWVQAIRKSGIKIE